MTFIHIENQKNVFDLLYCNIGFVEVVWNRMAESLRNPWDLETRPVKVKDKEQKGEANYGSTASARSRVLGGRCVTVWEEPPCAPLPAAFWSAAS